MSRDHRDISTETIQSRRTGRGGSQAANPRTFATSPSAKQTNLSSELDMFDYGGDRVSSSKFQAARKKLKDHLGILFGHNAHIIDQNEEFEFEEPAEPAGEELTQEADPHGFKKRRYER